MAASAWRRVALLLMLVTASAQAEIPADPLQSPAWRYLAQRYFGEAGVVFDPRVKLLLPVSAENPLSVPVHVDARALAEVREILVFADLNPIPVILRYEPGAQAEPSLGFRFKVQQATPVRAAVRTGDGQWHLGGAWIDAAGGGCTTPSLGTGSGLWKDHFGEISGHLWPRENGVQRLRLRVIHPMDTGLAGGIPAFYLDELQLQNGKGELLAKLQGFEPLAENPLLSFDLRNAGVVRVLARDTQANQLRGSVAP